MTDSKILSDLWKGRRVVDDGLFPERMRDDKTDAHPLLVLRPLIDAGLIERCAKSPVTYRYFEFQLTDAGLREIGKPTRSEAAKVELVSGPDVRKVRRSKR